LASNVVIESENEDFYHQSDAMVNGTNSSLFIGVMGTLGSCLELGYSRALAGLATTYSSCGSCLLAAHPDILNDLGSVSTLHIETESILQIQLSIHVCFT